MVLDTRMSVIDILSLGRPLFRDHRMDWGGSDCETSAFGCSELPVLINGFLGRLASGSCTNPPALSGVDGDFPAELQPPWHAVSWRTVIPGKSSISSTMHRLSGKQKCGDTARLITTPQGSGNRWTEDQGASACRPYTVTPASRPPRTLRCPWFHREEHGLRKFMPRSRLIV